MIANVLIGLIGLYKRVVSPLLPKRCRFYPTCSDYAVEAVRQHGALRGLGMAAGRLMRCHPLHEGGPDPVPLPKDKYLLKAKHWWEG